MSSSPSKGFPIVFSVSLLAGLSVPAMWLIILNTQRNDTFFGSLPRWLVYPGYRVAALLFPELAHNESAGLTLLFQSLAINFAFYFLVSFTLGWLIIKLRSMTRGQ